MYQFFYLLCFIPKVSVKEQASLFFFGSKEQTKKKDVPTGVRFLHSYALVSGDIQSRALDMSMSHFK